MVRVRKVFIFLVFIKEVIADLNALVAALIHLPNVFGELIFGDSLQDPYPARLEVSWDSERPASSDFTLGKRNKFIGVIYSE
jgi:hypothetical protein